MKTVQERLELRKNEEERLKALHKPHFKVGDLVNLINQVSVFEEYHVFRITDIETKFHGRMPKISIYYTYNIGEWDCIRHVGRNGYSLNHLQLASEQNIRIARTSHIREILNNRVKYIPLNLKEKYISNYNYTLVNFVNDIEVNLKELYLPTNPTLAQQAIFYSKYYEKNFAFHNISKIISNSDYSYQEKDEVYHLIKSIISILFKQNHSMDIYWLEHKPTTPTELLIQHKEDLKATLRANLEVMEKTVADLKISRPSKTAIKRYLKYMNEELINPLNKLINEVDSILKSRPEAVAQLSTLLA